MNLKQAATDIAIVVLLAILSLVAGLAINQFSAQPIALAYKSPAERLQAELSQLVQAPPFESFPVATVGLDQFRKAVDGGSTLILDARSSVYYRQGHVPGALNLSRDEFARDYLRLRSKLRKEKEDPIIVYCSGGSCHDSKMVAQALTSLGFSRVRIFAGGWEAWSAAGLPAARG